jgi:hypothetical protein
MERPDDQWAVEVPILALRRTSGNVPHHPAAALRATARTSTGAQRNIVGVARFVRLRPEKTCACWPDWDVWGLGADILALQPSGFAIGGTLAVIGFLQFAMGLGHDVGGPQELRVKHLNLTRIPQFSIPGTAREGRWAS